MQPGAHSLSVGASTAGCLAGRLPQIFPPEYTSAVHPVPSRNCFRTYGKRQPCSQKETNSNWKMDDRCLNEGQMYTCKETQYLFRTSRDLLLKIWERVLVDIQGNSGRTHSCNPPSSQDIKLIWSQRLIFLFSGNNSNCFTHNQN